VDIIDDLQWRELKNDINVVRVVERKCAPKQRKMHAVPDFEPDCFASGLRERI
jgi:hypothetical protein